MNQKEKLINEFKTEFKQSVLNQICEDIVFSTVPDDWEKAPNQPINLRIPVSAESYIERLYEKLMNDKTGEKILKTANIDISELKSIIFNYILMTGLSMIVIKAGIESKNGKKLEKDPFEGMTVGNC